MKEALGNKDHSEQMKAEEKTQRRDKGKSHYQENVRFQPWPGRGKLNSSPELL